ncbi:coth protein-domain-containing protein [Neocallimastix sp. 'constans']
MKMKKIITLFSLLIISCFVNASSKSDFFGKNDTRAELFKILDDHVGNIKITLDDDMWASMKEKAQFRPWDYSRELEKYGTTNATLEFYVKGTDYKASLGPNEFNFYLAGQGSRQYNKPGYNIKLENGSIYDVKLLRLRGNPRDPTFLHEKLSSDMLYKMNFPATSTNYVNVEVNGEDLGLFIITNKIKKDFIKKHFNDKSTNNLYDCKNSGTRFEDNTTVSGCDNSKEELIDFKDDLQELTDSINNAKSIEDLEKIIDVDSVLKLFAFEYLVISFDQFLHNSHNFSLYKKPDGKWMILINDYDESWGCNFNNFAIRNNKFADFSYIPSLDYLYLPNFSFRDFEVGHKIVKYLVYDDDTRFREIIGETVKTVFNPKILIPRIDELSKLIREHVASTRNVDEDGGVCKGCINLIGLNPKWNITQFDDCTNYTHWISNNCNAYSYGLKFFIEERFKYICHTYGINPKTLELIEPRPKVSFWGIKNKHSVSYTNYNFFLVDNLMAQVDYPEPLVKFDFPDLDKEDFRQEAYNADPENNDKPVDYEYKPFTYELEESKEDEELTNEKETEIKDEIKTEIINEIETEIRDEIETETIDEIETEIRDEIESEIENEIENKTENKKEAKGLDKLFSKLIKKVQSFINKKKEEIKKKNEEIKKKNEKSKKLKEENNKRRKY